MAETARSFDKVAIIRNAGVLLYRGEMVVASRHAVKDELVSEIEDKDSAIGWVGNQKNKVFKGIKCNKGIGLLLKCFLPHWYICTVYTERVYMYMYVFCRCENINCISLS